VPDERAGVTERRSGSTRPSLDGPSIRDVSDTARWVAVYRAEESDRPDALFVDPHARRLAGERGEAIVDSLPFGRTMAWSIVVRTVLMDEIILKCVARGARTVVNLGAGLDTRAFRLGLPRSLRWLDVDLPAVIAYRRECLDDAAASCRQQHVGADLGDVDARARVLAAARADDDGPLLVVSEGLLVYLAPEQVAELATQLHDESAARWWVTDLITPVLQGTMGTVWHAQLAEADAPFRFAPQDSRGFFAPLGWHEAEFHSTWSESARLGRRAPNGAAWDALLTWSGPAAQVAVSRMSGVALLERVA
jgi:methyltransferase (TIGR00027 family)